jgi:hypothetical protein
VDQVGVLEDVLVRLEDPHVVACVVVGALGDLREAVTRLDDVVAVDVGILDLDVGDEVVLPSREALDLVPEKVLVVLELGRALDDQLGFLLVDVAVLDLQLLGLIRLSFADGLLVPCASGRAKHDRPPGPSQDSGGPAPALPAGPRAAPWRSMP